MSRRSELDDRGWKIPERGTRSWEVYHLLRDGWGRAEIAALYGPHGGGIYTVCNNIIGEGGIKREDRVEGEEYIQKLMGILGWSREQAVAEVRRQEEKARTR
jgi:hypothetical protein